MPSLVGKVMHWIKETTGCRSIVTEVSPFRAKESRGHHLEQNRPVTEKIVTSHHTSAVSMGI
jgi:hypothetical protein